MTPAQLLALKWAVQQAQTFTNVQAPYMTPGGLKATRAKIDLARQALTELTTEPQVVGRVHHYADGKYPMGVLNSVGRALPDNTPLYTRS